MDPPLVCSQSVLFLGNYTTTQNLSVSTTVKMADRPASPTPEERQKLDKEAKAKEEAEQNALPYKWTQTIKDLDITISVPANLKGRDLDVKITKTGVKAGIKGQSPVIEVRHAQTPPECC